MGGGFRRGVTWFLTDFPVDHFGSSLWRLSCDNGDNGIALPSCQGVGWWGPAARDG